MAVPNKVLQPMEGDTFCEAATCVNSAGAVLDVSGYTWEAQLRSSPGGTAADTLIYSIIPDVSHASGGVVTLTVPAAYMLSQQSSSSSKWPKSPPQAWLSLAYKDGSGNVVTVCTWLLQLQYRITVVT